jgi:hypothetical protein
MIQPKVLEESIVGRPLQSSVKSVHGQDEQRGRERVTLTNATGKIYWRPSLPIDHDRGERRSKNAAYKIAKNIAKSSAPEHLQQEFPRESVESLRDIYLH